MGGRGGRGGGTGRATSESDKLQAQKTRLPGTLLNLCQWTQAAQGNGASAEAPHPTLLDGWARSASC
jgi:hypothetical protein